MIRLIPPVSLPVRPAEVAASVLSSRSGTESFADALVSATGFPAVSLFGSGRAALAASLARPDAASGGEVVVPAYTCWSVPAAVVRAGLRVRLADVDPRTLDFDAGVEDALRSPNVVSIVLAHLFARSCDVEGLVAVVGGIDRPVRIVEDAAQAWPDGPASRLHACILSFGRGKPLPLGTGGAVLHHGRGIGNAPRVRPGGLREAVSLTLASLLAKPSWYRIPESLPFLRIGETIYEPNFRAERPFRDWQGNLGVHLLERLRDFSRRRTEHARTIAGYVGAQPGWTLPAPARLEGLVRLPVLAPSGESRDRALRALRRLGVGASPMYPGTLADIPALRPHLANPEAKLPGAREIANRLLTLPVYPGLSDRDVRRIGTVFERVATELGR